MARHEDKARQDMAILDELIKYFQSETSVLDHQFFLDTHTLPDSTYVSCIRVNGAPILPPLMTSGKKEEMLSYKKRALQTEVVIKARARQKLLSRVQNVMSEIDGRRTNSRLGETLCATSDLVSAQTESQASGDRTTQHTPVCKPLSPEPIQNNEAVVTETEQEPGGVVPPLDLQEVSQCNVVLDSGISSRPVTAATAQESLQDGQLDTMADVTDFSEEEQEALDDTLPKEGWSPRSADSGVSKGDQSVVESIALAGDGDAKVQAEADTSESNEEKPDTIQEKVRDAAEMLLQQTDSEAPKETSSQAAYPTVTDQVATVSGGPVGMVSTNSSCATGSSGTTVSSEEMNRTVISKEEARCYQTWNELEKPQEDQNCLEGTDSDSHGQPRWALLSKVALNPDGETPDTTPEASNQGTVEPERTDADNASTVEDSVDHDASGGSEHLNDEVLVASLVPTSAPDISSISHATQESEMIERTADSQRLAEPANTQAAEQSASSTDLQTMHTESTDLAPYMAVSQDLLSSHTTLPHVQAVNTTMSDVQHISMSDHTTTNSSKHNTSDTTLSSGQPTPKRGRARSSSYTLDHPSPVLVAAHVKAQTATAKSTQSKDNSPASVFQLTNSMEDLKLQTVQRKLHYEQEHTASETESTSITEAARLRVKIPKIKILASESESTSESEAGKLKTRIESEKEGKQEHLHRYLQHLTSESDASCKDNAMEYSAPGVAADTWAQEKPVDPLTLVKENPVLLQYLSDEELLQLQMQYFEQLRQQLVLQQQQQLTQMLMEQERQQQLFQHEILEQERQLRASRSASRASKNKSRPLSDGQTDSVAGPVSKVHVDTSALMESSDVQHAFDLSLLSSASSNARAAMRQWSPTSMQRPDSEVRPVSAPTPHVHFAPNTKYAGSSLHGIYQSANFQQQPKSNSLQVGADSRSPPTSDSSHSPAELRSAFTRIHPRNSRQQQEGRLRHSPRAKMPAQRYGVLDPNIPIEIHKKFEKVSAAAKGFLTRRLLRTERVQDLIKTVKDTAQFAITFQQETPIKRGVYSQQDENLQQRVLAQLDAAMYEIHEIFFEISTRARMAIIAQSRALERERMYKAEALKKANYKQKRLSGATLKAMERKRKLKAAEEAVFGEARPKSAPPATNSCSARSAARHSDISGPLRRTFQFTMDRAIRPTRGRISPSKPAKETLNRVAAKQNGMSKATVKTEAGTAKMPRKTVHSNQHPVAVPIRKVAGRNMRNKAANVHAQ